MRLSKSLSRFMWLVLLMVFALPIAAQEETDPAPTISVQGPVTSIDGALVTVGDMVFLLAEDDPILATLAVGDMVIVESSGDADEDGVLEALSFTVTDAALSAATVTIIGAVESIQLNVVTVAGYQIQFDIDDATLADLDLGDVVEITGSTVSLGGVIVVIPSVVIIIEIPDPTETPEVTPETTPESTAEATPEATPDPDDTTTIIIVIEGPVEEINGNIIIIYDFEIRLDEDDPLLTVIQIGDIIRVEGELLENADVIIIIAVVVIIIDVEIIIDGDIIWRGDSECNNPPPPWAPAHGWRRKCEGRDGGSNRGSRSS